MNRPTPRVIHRREILFTLLNEHHNTRASPHAFFVLLVVYGCVPLSSPQLIPHEQKSVRSSRRQPRSRLVPIKRDVLSATRLPVFYFYPLPPRYVSCGLKAMLSLPQFLIPVRIFRTWAKPTLLSFCPAILVTQPLWLYVTLVTTKVLHAYKAPFTHASLNHILKLLSTLDISFINHNR